jgi:hypothetical protein
MPGVKRMGREADHSCSSSTEVKNGGAIPPLSHGLISKTQEQIYLCSMRRNEHAVFNMSSQQYLESR